MIVVAGAGHISTMAWAAQSSEESKTTSKASKKKPTKKKSARKKSTRRFSAAEIRRLQRIRKTFVASADLKIMAQQLLQARTPQAYAGVEDYAAKHKGDDAAPLAWLVLGYAHSLDSDYPKALAAWRNTQPLAPLMGDVLDTLRAGAYEGEKDPASVITVLEGFEQRYPESVLHHEAAMLYANALTATGDAKKAIAFLEHHRQPLRADVEFALGKAYQGDGDHEKASAVFSRIYYDLPLSPEADIIHSDLKTFTVDATYDARFRRADLLLKGKRYAQAASELSTLADEAPESQLSNVLGEQGVALYRDHKRDAAQKVLERVLKSGKATREAQAQAYYVLAEIAREKDDTKHYHELLELARGGPGKSVAAGDAFFRGQHVSAEEGLRNGRAFLPGSCGARPPG